MAVGRRAAADDRDPARGRRPRRREFVRLLAGREVAGLGFGTGFDHAKLPEGAGQGGRSWGLAAVRGPLRDAVHRDHRGGRQPPGQRAVRRPLARDRRQRAPRAPGPRGRRARRDRARDRAGGRRQLGGPRLPRASSSPTAAGGSAPRSARRSATRSRPRVGRGAVRAAARRAARPGARPSGLAARRRRRGLARRGPPLRRARRLRAALRAAGRHRRRAGADARARRARDRAQALGRGARRDPLGPPARPTTSATGSRRSASATARPSWSSRAPTPTAPRRRWSSTSAHGGSRRSSPRSRPDATSSSAPWSTAGDGDPVEHRRAPPAPRSRRPTAPPAPPPAARRPTERIRHSFHEARCALEATGFANGTAPDVASHRDLGAFTLLLSVQDAEALRLYCESVLGPIEDSDERYAGELLRSLEAYIERNGHWERAAGRLLLPPPHPALPDQAGRGADRPRPQPRQRPGRDVARAAGEGADRVKVAVLGAGGTIAPGDRAGPRRVRGGGVDAAARPRPRPSRGGRRFARRRQGARRRGRRPLRARRVSSTASTSWSTRPPTASTSTRWRPASRRAATTSTSAASTT